MITVIAGTNRRESNSLKVANNYIRLLQKSGVSVQLLDLSRVPKEVFSAGNYPDKPQPLLDLQTNTLQPTQKFVFVCPEYNGSFPGILKTLIDVCDIKSCFYHKKACLVGVASGRAGNLRGMDHLTNILNHIKVQVMVNKIPISKVDEQLDANGLFNKATEKLAVIQLNEFLNF